ncbi:hypothetical protein QZM97_26240 [Burkholderia orbicola]|uniref:hypothetical protein n=1 Tax=Burkholderia orbicola TaxID=2978683 RepID=UPI00265660DB|nr:hypothetical protein [Burkholderia orbicola]MDN7993583.1 hypothetical protein [Burkholderia orbicola]
MAGFFDPTDPTAGGLMNAFAPSNGMPGMMGMLANPQTAGMLGMAGGLLQAAGPSRLPVTIGQAMGAGLSGMGQGVGNAFQTQQQLLRMRAMQGLMGGDVGQPGAQPQSAPSYSSMFGPASTAPATMPPTSGAAPDTSGAPAQTSGASIYGRSPQQLFQQGMLMNMAGIQGGGDMMRIAVEHDPSLAAMMPTDITKMGMQGGMSPDEIQSANRAGVTKANYIAPTALRTPIYFNPQTGKTEVVPADQLAQGYGAMYGAEARAQAGYKPMQVWDPNANGGQGGYVYQTTTQVADAANGGGANGGAGVPTGGLAGIFAQQESNGGKTDPSNPFQIQQATFNRFAQPGESWNNVADRNTVAQRMLTQFNQQYGGDLGRIATAYFSGEGNVAPPGSATPFIHNVSDSNGKSVASYVGDILGRSGGMAQGGQGAPMAAQPPLGQGQFAQGQVQQMQQRWGALRDQNANAQTVISQLQNISSLAPAAITGAEADKRAYVNGLLSLVGVSGAQDAKTATDLLGKYSNQIIAKLGQGGLGTDAARSIVEAGNPNAHMTVPAIQEAVRNLQGQYQMVQAKTNLLQQFANGNNPTAYSKAETAFDQNADPRIWEYQSIQDPAMRQQFAAGVLKQDPKFGKKIQALEKLGAL